MAQYSEIQKDLEQLLEKLRHRTAKVKSSLRTERDDDSQERAQQSENDEVLERLDEGGTQEIEAVQGALARIEAGTYGTCYKCQEQISGDRLKALPFARTCIDCAT